MCQSTGKCCPTNHEPTIIADVIVIAPAACPSVRRIIESTSSSQPAPAAAAAAAAEQTARSRR